VLRKVPEAIESFQDRAVTLLKDRHHAVMLGGVTLMLEICSIEPALISVYQAQVPTLCKMLRSMLTGGFLPDYDVGGITNPFLQVKVPIPSARSQAEL
jgi:AP-1 complex subunit gamma-1